MAGEKILPVIKDHMNTVGSGSRGFIKYTSAGKDPAINRAYWVGCLQPENGGAPMEVSAVTDNGSDLDGDEISGPVWGKFDSETITVTGDGTIYAYIIGEKLS